MRVWLTDLSQCPRLVIVRVTALPLKAQRGRPCPVCRRCTLSFHSYPCVPAILPLKLVGIEQIDVRSATDVHTGNIGDSPG